MFARGLVSLGLCPEKNIENGDWKFLGIVSRNREEWMIAQLACNRANITIVPFFDSLGVETLSYVANQCELTTICVEAKTYDVVVNLKQSEARSLKNIISFDTVSIEMKLKAE